MLSNEKVDYLKNHFYGWEYAVQNNLPVKMTHEHIELLMNVFIDLEDLKDENDKLKRLIEDMKLPKLYGKDIERAERKKIIIQNILDAKDKDFTIKKIELSDEHKEYLRRNVKFTIKFK